MSSHAYPPELPRSVRLALWLSHSEHDPLGPLEAARFRSVLEDDDEPHTLSDPALATGGLTPSGTAAVAPGATAGSSPGAAPGPPGSPGGFAPSLLADAVGAWQASGCRAAAVLPVPGDVAGVPHSISAAALEAEECVLVTVGNRRRHFALVPDIEGFGSEWEPGFHVGWTAVPVPPWENLFMGAVGTLAEAERELRIALRTATEALDGLDVAKWRPDAADAIGALGAGVSDHWDLPAGMGVRQIQVLGLAARLRLIVDLATADDGGSINLWQADQRSAALREIDHAARRAMAAATYVV